MSCVILLCDVDLALWGLSRVEACLLGSEVALLDLEAEMKAVAKVTPCRHGSSSKQV